MNTLFEKTSSTWVAYSDYEWKQSADGTLYLCPTPTAHPEIYDPIKNAQDIVLDALNIGQMRMKREPDAAIQAAILTFARKYGLLGLMTALPTTSKFMDYEAVYLPKNHFIKEETMATLDYLNLFFPFQKPEIIKRGVESVWDIRSDREMMALALTMAEKPTAVNLALQRSYAERYDWLKQQFLDWTFTFLTSYFYYDSLDSLDQETRKLYRDSMAAFDGIAPTYHVALYDKPTIVWDFHSLLLGIQMMFSFLLTEDDQPLRVCRNCNNIFLARRSNAVFCSPQCKNQYNVQKRREKGK
jgi:hypothetical protein